jgi:molybdopterin-guanine dinucleotide biosynthesis protein A
MPEGRQSRAGLLLAGGRAQRMGGQDKGLLMLRGRPLAQHVLARLAPQVGPLLISANRHQANYLALGHPVLGDTLPDYPGPLAGWLAGLTALADGRLDAPGRVDWLLAVPCDCPLLPTDLGERLAAALRAQPDARLAVPVLREDGELRVQAAFCLMHRSLRDALAAHLANGERRVQDWLRRAGALHVPFEAADDARAFVNANRPEELQALEQSL